MRLCRIARLILLFARGKKKYGGGRCYRIAAGPLGGPPLFPPAILRRCFARRNMPIAGRHLSGGGAICNRPGRNRPAAETHGGGDLAAELSLPRAMIVCSCRQIPPTWRPQ